MAADHHKQSTRDIKRLLVTPFSLVLRRKYFDCPQRDSHAVHYIKKRGEKGVCTLVLYSLATVTSCIDASVRIVTKSPKVGPLLIFSTSMASTCEKYEYILSTLLMFAPYVDVCEQ